MALKRLREVGRFPVRAENGTVYHVIEYAHMLDASVFEHPGREIEGLHELVTHDGMHVNVLGENEYEILDLALKVKRVPPR